MERAAEAALFFVWVFGCGFLVVVGGESSHVNALKYNAFQHLHT